MSIPIYFCRVIHGPLLGTCCHGLIPHPGNMPQQWFTLNPVILITYIYICNISPAMVHPEPCHLLHISTQSFKFTFISFYFKSYHIIYYTQIYSQNTSHALKT
ncbi:hypothetical protein PAXRUDRAFT_176639 [Paxillus rubicundulus Ve08.2h10]|uniref:Uncharacterized protein n=1 Tax=Paxillus rubicundulus Ve08.2h10 TaxID=930991 RepID=A0A0D0D2J0_9AGAM|nr:hypothetical protein PAXRUDRAFT_176639 [Paxillus rubicundulus Ve08.2h10]